MEARWLVSSSAAELRRHIVVFQWLSYRSISYLREKGENTAPLRLFLATGWIRHVEGQEELALRLVAHCAGTPAQGGPVPDGPRAPESAAPPCPAGGHPKDRPLVGGRSSKPHVWFVRSAAGMW